mgnify:CR=1 FL=1
MFVSDLFIGFYENVIFVYASLLLITFVFYKISNKINFKSFTVTDAQNADEAFITSATTFVTPVIKINDNKISKGEPGKFTKALRERYIQKAREIAI